MADVSCLDSDWAGWKHDSPDQHTNSQPAAGRKSYNHPRSACHERSERRGHGPIQGGSASNEQVIVQSSLNHVGSKLSLCNSRCES